MKGRDDRVFDVCLWMTMVAIVAAFALLSLGPKGCDEIFAADGGKEVK